MFTHPARTVSYGYHRGFGAEEPYTGESMPDEDLSTSDAGWSPVTGYYTDSGGYAWYYNATSDYMEAVAAPKSTRLTGTRFSAASGPKYAKMKGVLTESAYKGNDAAAKDAVIRNATGTGGEKVVAPAPGRGSAPAAAPVPEDVAERGEENLKEGAKDGKKKVGILAGVTSGIPTWAWWTAGGLTLAGGGYMLYRIYKK